MVSVLSKTQTFTNNTPNDATPVDSSFVDAFNNDSTLATAVTAIENGNIVTGTTLLLNSAFAGSPTADQFFSVERGSANNTGFKWDETNDRWLVTNDGTNYYPLALVVAADPTPAEGWVWFNTTTHQLKYYDGTNTIILGYPRCYTSAKSANYTVIATDLFKEIICTGTFTLSLTAAATLGDGFLFAVRNNGTGTITIDPNGAETIDGRSTIKVRPGEAFWVNCNGTAFATIGRVPFFESTAQTITAAGTLTLAHGLGLSPKTISVALTCTSADLGYSVNDEYQYYPFTTAALGYGISIRVDSTNLSIVYGGATGVLLITAADGTSGVIDPTKWTAKFRAWA